jgi:phage shock protein C
MSSSAPENEKKTSHHVQSSVRKLYRRPKTGKIAGVCSGLAEYFAVDVTLLRVAFIIFTFISGGFGILVYFVLAIIMPVQSGEPNEASDNFQELATEVKSVESTHRMRNYAGVGIILLGIWLLLAQMFPDWIDTYGAIFWPMILIAIGAVILLRSGK